MNKGFDWFYGFWTKARFAVWEHLPEVRYKFRMADMPAELWPMMSLKEFTSWRSFMDRESIKKIVCISPKKPCLASYSLLLARANFCGKSNSKQAIQKQCISS